MLPRVSCLMPTYNRFPHLRVLVNEAVECFLKQDYPNAELLICNDTPGQRLIYNDPRVKIFNLAERMPTLTGKINYLIEQATGDLFCRWDDDDIHLPWRLSLSVDKLGDDKFEWRANNHWFSNQGAIEKETIRPGNTHTMAIWTRELLSMIGGYPKGLSGNEDQEFNKILAKKGINKDGETLPREQIFYIYRWGVGGPHLSGLGGGPAWNPHQPHYDMIGTYPIQNGAFKIEPGWREDYLASIPVL